MPVSVIDADIRGELELAGALALPAYRLDVFPFFIELLDSLILHIDDIDAALIVHADIPDGKELRIRVAFFSDAQVLCQLELNIAIKRGSGIMDDFDAVFSVDLAFPFWLLGLIGANPNLDRKQKKSY
jgi:hypothetical protein